MEDLQIIKEMLSRIEANQQLLLARRDIENLIGRYAHLHALGRDRQIVDDLWSEQETSTIESGFSGVYKLHGRLSGIEDFYKKAYGMSSDRIDPVTKEEGRMYIDAWTSPIIEIAADGKTAKGSWLTAGLESRIFSIAVSCSPKKHTANWIWNRIGVDFIKEETGWKIWHMHIYETMKTPYSMDWIDYASQRADDDAAYDTWFRSENPFLLPSGPSRDYWQYSPSGRLPEVAPLPEPYTDFDSTFAY